MKKQIKEVATIQAQRLEQAMITGRRWTPEEFDTLLVKHPLMVNLVRQLVLAAYDGAGKVTQTFRVMAACTSLSLDKRLIYRAIFRSEW